MMTDLRIGGSLTPPLDFGQSAQQKAAAPKTFADTLKDSIQSVENQQKAADRSINDLATGRSKALHETMIQVEQADVAFKMLLAVRTKLVNAYHEVIRMQF